MTKECLKKRIDAAAGRRPADLVIKNAQIVDVYGGGVVRGDIAVVDGLIAGVGAFEGKSVHDAGGRFALPGLIDSHIHIESSFLTPEEFGRMVVPHGTTTVISDPHEIVNVKGLQGLDYMMRAAAATALDIKYMLPSCVPATPFEHAGAAISARDMAEIFNEGQVLGLGEFMDFPGVAAASDSALERLLAAHRAGVVIDGHSPGISGNALNAYIAAGITTEHECTTVEGMNERISKGMYILMRQGSAAQDLANLAAGVTALNSSRCLLCSDDMQAKTILDNGHMDNHLRICVKCGIDPITAVRMATLNAAACYNLRDRGAIAPGLRADIVLMDDLAQFKADAVFIKGELVAHKGKYLPPFVRACSAAMESSFNVKDFTKDKLKLRLKSENVHVIEILPGRVVTKKSTARINIENGDFVRNEKEDIVKIAVVERHQNTGNVGVALLGGYGISAGAIALSIAHDSHNILVTGTNDDDMAFAVQSLINLGGGVVLAKNGAVLESMPLPICGLMSNQSGQWVDRRLAAIHKAAHDVLGVHKNVEPLMTLSFMALPVIPELKVTNLGLFDVTDFALIPICTK